MTTEELIAAIVAAPSEQAAKEAVWHFAGEINKSVMQQVEHIRRWKVCEQCGKHLARYIASGDDGDTDLCACCYGEPYDASECAVGTGLERLAAAIE